MDAAPSLARNTPVAPSSSGVHDCARAARAPRSLDHLAEAGDAAGGQRLHRAGADAIDADLLPAEVPCEIAACWPRGWPWPRPSRCSSAPPSRRRSSSSPRCCRRRSSSAPPAAPARSANRRRCRARSRKASRLVSTKSPSSASRGAKATECSSKSTRSVCLRTLSKNASISSSLVTSHG